MWSRLSLLGIILCVVCILAPDHACFLSRCRVSGFLLRSWICSGLVLVQVERYNFSFILARLIVCFPYSRAEEAVFFSIHLDTFVGSFLGALFCFPGLFVSVHYRLFLLLWLWQFEVRTVMFPASVFCLGLLWLAGIFCSFIWILQLVLGFVCFSSSVRDDWNLDEESIESVYFQ